MSDTSDKIYEQIIEIDLKDIVAPYNHMHHAVILFYMEKCRDKLLEDMGFSSKKLLENKIFPAISSVEVDYMRETKEGPLKIVIDKRRMKRKVIEISQKVYTPAGKLAVSAVVSCVLFSMETQRAIVPSEEFVEAFLTT